MRWWGKHVIAHCLLSIALFNKTIHHCNWSEDGKDKSPLLRIISSALLPKTSPSSSFHILLFLQCLWSSLLSCLCLKTAFNFLGSRLQREREGGERPGRMPEAQWQLGGRRQDQRVRVSDRHRHAVILWASVPAAFTQIHTQIEVQKYMHAVQYTVYTHRYSA